LAFANPASTKLGEHLRDFSRTTEQVAMVYTCKTEARRGRSDEPSYVAVVLPVPVKMGLGVWALQGRPARGLVGQIRQYWSYGSGNRYDRLASITSTA
jgi:hypothetical protein